MNTIKAINDDKDKLKTLWNRIYELEAEHQEISALFPDDATHKHGQTGESLYDNIQDALRDLARAKADLAAAREDVVRMSKQIAEYEEAEASVCPEDVGFVEFIGVLQKRIEQLKTALVGVTPSYRVKGKCWCPHWLDLRSGHSDECKAARALALDAWKEATHG